MRDHGRPNDRGPVPPARTTGDRRDGLGLARRRRAHRSDRGVKLLHPHLAADRAARRRLRFEAAALAAIEHPNVVAVRDVVSEASGPALIMDWVDGRSLAERIAADGALPEAEAVAIARDIADGLAVVHEHGIVHRDLKPSNILLDTDGRAHLIDLGIAADAEADGSALTATDGVVGTMRYLAPERLVGESAVPATDVWGLGAVLYEMLSGEVAFPSSTVLERAESGARVPDRPDGVSDATWRVVERALVADPDRRYPDAGAMAVGPAGHRRGGQGVPADPWAATTVIPTARTAAAAAGAIDRRSQPGRRGRIRSTPAADAPWSRGAGARGRGRLVGEHAGPAVRPVGHAGCRVERRAFGPRAGDDAAAPAPPADAGGDGDDDGAGGNGRGNGNGGGNGNGNGGGNGRGNGND